MADPAFLSSRCKGGSPQKAESYSLEMANKYDFFPVCLKLLTNHETLHNLNIVLSFDPPSERHCPFYNYRSVTKVYELQSVQRNPKYRNIQHQYQLSVDKIINLDDSTYRN